MRFSRLRLSGFKSFVEPTELVIADGLTGVVGPNGCGKSNLLEALRWVMGESSYKSMRASGMDDVIFSGTASRPARNMAEVLVTLERGSQEFGPPYSEADNLEIARRIEREAGSAYRINGKDVRARDVQLLFADASTGARSPALVRQGQIGEIINAKPQARRRILEEAAGITGLHTRRHEAELKLNAAETNLTRLDDVIAQLESQLQSLKRQARQAQRYKQLSADIRRLEAAILYTAWQEAEEILRGERSKFDEIALQTAALTRQVSEKTRAHDAASEVLPKFRENEATRGAVLQRLTLEREGLDREEREAATKREDLENRQQQIAADLSRERELAGDTDKIVSDLGRERGELETALENDAEARAEAARALQAAADTLAAAQEAADAAAAGLSQLNAERNAIEATAKNHRERISRLDREVSELDGRKATLAGGSADAEQAKEMQAAVDKALEAAQLCEDNANRCEAEVQTARQAETEARQAHDGARRRAESLSTEISTLHKLLNVNDGDLWPPLVDAMKVEPGYETALGAALGDDIDASADEAAPVHWRALSRIDTAQGLPAVSRVLSEFVKAPDALARRLQHTGVIADDTDGFALQGQLAPGQRLVSKSGALWRWDGFHAAADAPSAAANRLAERNRLGALEEERDEAAGLAQSAKAALDEAVEAARQAAAGERDSRQAWREATAAVETARKALAEHERKAGERSRQLSTLEEAARRVSETLNETRAMLAEAEAKLTGLPETGHLESELSQLRQAVDDQRTAYSDVRSTHDTLERDARQRTGRIKSIGQDLTQWNERAKKTVHQISALESRGKSVAEHIAALDDAPEKFDARRQKLLSMLSQAEKERNEASDQLAKAEAAAGEAASQLREAEAKLAESRELQAGLSARIDGATQRQNDVFNRICEELDCKPAEILERSGLEEDQIPARPVIDSKLSQLRDQRERLGGVNLRAEEEAGEVQKELDNLVNERDDLVSAIQKLRHGISSLNREGRQRLVEAFERVNNNFAELFTTLFNGGQAELQLIESDDPLEAGLEILANPPGKRPQVLSLLSGGEQALTAMSLIFAVFLTNPSPICVLDEVDAPLDDYNVERFCNLLDAMLERTDTRFLIITHHALTMARVHRLFGVTMAERGVSQLVSVDLEAATALREAG